MRTSMACVGLLSGTLFGCGGGSTPEPEAPRAEMTMASAPAEERKQPEQPVAQPLNDRQIAAMTNAANAGEIEQARLAQQKSRNERVKQFAAMMIADHGDARKKQAALLKQLGLVPAESLASALLSKDSARTTEMLSMVEGAEFDRKYIDAQVNGHAKVLNAFDVQLIPSAQNPELRASLVDFRPKIEAHLADARAIQRELASEPE